MRLVRERQGLCLTDLAERTGIDRTAISKLETGKIPNPTVGKLKRHAAALGKSLSWTLSEAS
ncbi:MAG: helix-turn-helix domain-containing protein [Isosphaeraceae bacterium]